MLRPGYFHPSIRHTPSYEDDFSYPEKQQMREETAKLFAEHVGPRADIFVMPSYLALCAKTINRAIPQARFFGADFHRRIAMNVDELGHGKKIAMQAVSIEKYIVINKGTVHFDAAFLDYNGQMTTQRRREIVGFVDLLKPTSVLAVTVQGTKGNQARTLEDGLRAVVSSVSILFDVPYETKHSMLHMIFLLRRGRKI